MQLLFRDRKRPKSERNEAMSLEKFKNAKPANSDKLNSKQKQKEREDAAKHQLHENITNRKQRRAIKAKSRK